MVVGRVQNKTSLFLCAIGLVAATKTLFKRKEKIYIELTEILLEHPKWKRICVLSIIIAAISDFSLKQGQKLSIRT